jgi:diguanylate cyclase (GGDEF)-like protein
MLLRWAVLAAAILYLLIGRAVRIPLLGWMAIAGAAVANGLLALWRRQRPFSQSQSIVAQVVDTVALVLYTAALKGGIAQYLPLYTTMPILAAIRFGMWGAAGSGAVGLGLALGVWLTASSAGTPAPGESLAVTLVALVADVALLVYWAYLIRSQSIAHQQSEERLAKRVSELTVLNEVSSSVHDLRSEDALQNIVEIATKVMGYQRAALFLTDGMGEMIPHRYHSYRPPVQGARSAPIHMDPALFDELLEKQSPIVIDGSQGSSDMAISAALQIAVPLHSDRSAIGVLIADCRSRQTASRSDMAMLSNLARSAVVAIENASLHRQVRRMANHDGVTDLYNHRYFQERLREMLQSADGQRPVSLMMVEIDQFKRYNDTFGHRQGDTALFGLSRALEQSTAARDGLVARYGGDEFVVILPGVDQAEAIHIAREVRDQTYRLVAESLAEKNLPSVTLSIGVATFPEDARSAGDLIEAADQAMYVVKHSGGDRVHAYSRSGTTRT